MAYKNNKSSYNRGNKNKQGNSAKAYKDFAYMLGRVQAGIANSNSQVRASYDAGKNQAPGNKKKPLF